MAVPRRHGPRALSILLLFALCGGGLGCATQQYVTLRAEPHTPLAIPLQLYARSGPKPSRWTVQFLRQHDLLNKERVSSRWAVGDVAKIHREHPTAASCYALAELSFIAGRSAEMQSPEQAQGHYWSSIVHSYEYLFDPKYARIRTPYDPQFRSSCDLYNGSLESWMRMAQKAGTLKAGQTIAVRTKHQQADASVVSLGTVWKAEDFERFEFASDYEVTGLENLHVAHGLGVPLIAVRRAGTAPPQIEKYYAKGLSYPVTALLRPVSAPGDQESRSAAPTNEIERPASYRLEFYDPNEQHEVLVGRHRVPLESDITTPLAYFLNNPNFQKIDTYGLLFPQRLSKISGLYMVEPYQPGKIPVVMIHGLWSSPMTWMQAFNDLQSYREIREHYQFWFYLYPTGQAFPESAAALRRDLAEVKHTFGGKKANQELDQMVLVGHSMGGLIARSLAIEGPDSVQSVRRVVTIASPFRGSDDSNRVTRWLARQIIRVPSDTMAATRRFLLPGAPGEPKPELQGLTSIDSLSPNSPILQALLERKPLHRVVFNNIIGVVEGTPPQTGTDGVVTYASAHLDDDVESQLVVHADHMHVNQNPRTILELRRILHVHLKEQGIETGPEVQLLDGSSAGEEADAHSRSVNELVH